MMQSVNYDNGQHHWFYLYFSFEIDFIDSKITITERMISTYYSVVTLHVDLKSNYRCREMQFATLIIIIMCANARYKNASFIRTIERKGR